MKHISILVPVLLLVTFRANAQIISVGDYGTQPNSFADATVAVQKVITAAGKLKNAVISFPRGRYDFWPDSAIETRYYISNTSSEIEFPVKRQRVGLLFKNMKNIRIEGNGSLFVFHGKMISWAIDSCENITINNLSVNYERPGMSEMTLQKITPTSVEALVHPDSRFSIIDGRLEWYGEKWITKNYHAVVVKPDQGMLFYSDWQPFLKSKATHIGPLQVRFTGDFSRFKADSGNVLTIRDRYRDYVGVFQNRSKNIRLSNINMFSMHGLGIVSQFCENLTYQNVNVAPEEGGGRVIASSADGMHFSGCKGQITIDSCRFKGMHDDPVNVHGTHLRVVEKLSPTKLKLRFMHHQSYGFLPFIAGDSIALLHSKSLEIYQYGIIKLAHLVSERDVVVELHKPVAGVFTAGDAMENITWTPALTIRNSRFEQTISRGTLVTTRRKVLIENNVYYRTGMHAILIEDDASGWYESGPVKDVFIRNNQFIECGFNSQPGSYPIHINPQNHELIPGQYVHENIRIEGNFFKIFNQPVLSARSTKGLYFTNNKVEQSLLLPAGKAKPTFELTACQHVVIRNNSFYQGYVPDIKTEHMTAADLKTDIQQR